MSGFRVRRVKDSPLWSIGASYFSKKLQAAARNVPGMRWDSDRRAYIGYVDAIEPVVTQLREMELESDDAPKNKRKWKHNLPVSYRHARDYQKEGIDFLIHEAGAGALLADDMGCIDGGAIVQAAYGRRDSTHPITLSSLHRIFRDATLRSGFIPDISVMSLCGHELRPNLINDIFDKGSRPVVKITLKSGRTLRLTADHEVGMGVPPGVEEADFSRADELQVGMRVLIAGTGILDIDAVVSVVPDGEAHVYDIVCADPYRNFVANGIVVHNCGKSLQAIKAARALRRKTIVVCPAHVRGVWERPPELDDKGGELAKWWPKARVFPPYGLKTSAIPKKSDVVVIHYDIVHAWVEELLEWCVDDEVEYEDRDLTIIFDEAHVLLNPTSRRSKACRELAHAARGRIALTGTPPTDRVRDLYNIVDTISPDRFGPFFGFAIHHCDAHKTDVPGPDNTIKTVWTFDGKSNMKELRKRLDWFVLRRTKREVLKELPALQRQVVDVRVPPKNRLSMNARLVGDKRRMRMALDSAADGKQKNVLSLVKDHLEAGARVVVGTYRRAVCEKLADALNQVAPTAYIHGGIPITRRGKIIDKLKRVDGPCCLVANIDCASTGIDLTFAHVVVMAELVWEPRDLAQFESRTHRFGQEESVLVQYVIARGTGDELILQAVINKLDSFLDLVETDKGDGLKEALQGEKDEGLSRLAAALKKMGKKKKKRAQ